MLSRYGNDDVNKISIIFYYYFREYYISLIPRGARASVMGQCQAP
jgi:hypothetical protein